MEQKYFLKLTGVQGESENPRHYGEIEILGFSWGGDHMNSSGGRGKASFNDLSVVKQANRSSHYLIVARNSGQYFATGVLTVEDIAEWKSVVRTTRIEMSSIQISAFTSDGETDSVMLSCGFMRMVR
jgi:type VI secretion system secreted protein Hcp